MKKPKLVDKLDSTSEEDLGAVENQELSIAGLVLIADEEKEIKLGHKLLCEFLDGQRAT